MAKKAKIQKLLDKLREIKEIQEQVNSGFSSWANSLEISNKIMQEINALEDLSAELRSKGKNKKADAIDKEIKLLKKKQQLVAQERSLIKALWNDTKRITTEFAQQNFSLKQSLGYISEIDSVIRKTSQAMGDSGRAADLMRSSFKDVGIFAVRLGFAVKDLGKLQQIYTEETGRLVMFSDEAYKSLVLVSQATGLGAEFAAQLASEMERYGLGTKLTSKFIENVLNSSEQMGLNGVAVTKKIKDNIKTAQKFVFADGIKGLARMTQLSQKFRTNLDGVFAFAEKVQTIEGAIEAAANMQVLGGELGRQLSDPYRLLFESRNNIEKFQETIIASTRDVADFNETTKEFDISALGLRRLRIAAEQTGIPFEDLIMQAKEFNKLTTAKEQIGIFNLNEEDKDMISTMADVNEKGEFSITFDRNGKEVTKSLKELQYGDLQFLKREEASIKARAEAQMDWSETMQSILDELKITLLPFLHDFADILKWIKTKKVSFFGESGDIKAIHYIVGGLLTLLGTGGLKLLWNLFGGITNFMGTLGGKLSKIPGFGKSAGAGSGASGGGFASLFKGNMLLKGAIGLGAMGAALIPFAYGIKQLLVLDWKSFDAVKFASIVGTLSLLSVVLGRMQEDKLAFVGAAMTGIGIALIPLAKGIQMLTNSGWTKFEPIKFGILMTILSAAVYGIAQLPTNKLVQAALGLGAIGIAMIPLAYGLKQLLDADWKALDVGKFAGLMGTLTLISLGLGAIASSGVGLAALAAGMLALTAMGVVLIPLGYGMDIFSVGLMKFAEGLDALDKINVGSALLKLTATMAALTGLSGMLVLASPMILLANVALSALGGLFNKLSQISSNIPIINENFDVFGASLSKLINNINLLNTISVGSLVSNITKLGVGIMGLKTIGALISDGTINTFNLIGKAIATLSASLENAVGNLGTNTLIFKSSMVELISGFNLLSELSFKDLFKFSALNFVGLRGFANSISLLVNSLAGFEVQANIFSSGMDKIINTFNKLIGLDVSSVSNNVGIISSSMFKLGTAMGALGTFGGLIKIGVDTFSASLSGLVNMVVGITGKISVGINTFSSSIINLISNLKAVGEVNIQSVLTSINGLAQLDFMGLVKLSALNSFGFQGFVGTLSSFVNSLKNFEGNSESFRNGLNTFIESVNQLMTLDSSSIMKSLDSLTFGLMNFNNTMGIFGGFVNKSLEIFSSSLFNIGNSVVGLTERMTSGMDSFSNSLVNLVNNFKSLTELNAESLLANVNAISEAMFTLNKNSLMSGLLAPFMIFGDKATELASSGFKNIAEGISKIGDVDDKKLDKIRALFELANSAKPLQVTWDEELRVKFDKLVVEVDGEKHLVDMSEIMTEDWFREHFTQMLAGSSFKKGVPDAKYFTI